MTDNQTDLSPQKKRDYYLSIAACVFVFIAAFVLYYFKVPLDTDLFSLLAAGPGLFSALLWLKAARNAGDKISNARAACLSGSAVSLGAIQSAKSSLFAQDALIITGSLLIFICIVSCFKNTNTILFGIDITDD